MHELGLPQLSPEAWELYRQALQEQVISPDRKEVEELARLGVVVPDPTRPGFYIPAEPDRVAKTLRGGAVQALSAVTGYLAQLPGFVDAMTDEFRRAQRTETAAVEVITEHDDINGRLARASDALQSDAMTCHPGRRDRVVLENVEERDDKLLARGIKLRTLYHQSNRPDHWTGRWVRFVTERGAQVRTLPTPLPKLIIFDDREAFVGVYENGELMPGALHIRHAQIVGFVRAVFELHWERAEPWVPGVEPSLDPGGDQAERGRTPFTTPETRSILHGLAQGKSQKQVAKEHGISERTLISRLNVLKARLDIPTLPALMFWYGRSDERLLQD
ncbi:hypothetical protein ACFV3E_41925 [Streptomyces sp. NPDC059718]